MGFLGKLVAAPVRLLNIPVRGIEAALGEDGALGSGVLEDVAEAVEEATDETVGE